MQVSGFMWAGVRTESFGTTLGFFEKQMGLALASRDDEAGYAVFTLPSGQTFEVFAPGYEHYDRHECPAIGFEVSDIRQARQELEAAGAEFVSGFTEHESGAMWTHFRGPDGYLYGLQQRGPG